jgi:hypothetical protein
MKTFAPLKNEQGCYNVSKLSDVCSYAMNRYVSLSLTNRKSSDHLHTLYFPCTVLWTFTPHRDQLVICGQYFNMNISPLRSNIYIPTIGLA